MQDDLTFILGDIGPPVSKTFETIKLLNGKKILIRGNHDDVQTWREDERSVFDAIHDYVLSNGVLLIHRPEDRRLFSLDIDPKAPTDDFIIPKPEDKGAVKWVIHGHLHTIAAEKYAGDYKQFVRESNRYNCCVDFIDFAPRTVLELAYYKELAINTDGGNQNE